MLYHPVCLFGDATAQLRLLAGDNSVKIFHFDGEQCNLLHAQHKAHLQDVNCVAWHPTDSGTLASCSDDGSIRIWKFHADPDLGLGS